MKSYIINIQSIADIITNSSTEVYPVANNWTLQHIKAVIDSILKISNSNLTADDLFEFRLEKDEHLSEKFGYEFTNYNIIPKDDNYQEAAQLLSQLDNIFEYEVNFDN